MVRVIRGVEIVGVCWKLSGHGVDLRSLRKDLVFLSGLPNRMRRCIEQDLDRAIAETQLLGLAKQ
jgi:hypothetical protein